MQLTETVTIINKSGKVISNGKHIVNIFKEAKAAYQDKKAAIKAERAAVERPALRKAHTFDVRSRVTEEQYYEHDGQLYELPQRRHFLAQDEQYTYIGNEARLDDGTRSQATTARRSHATTTHRSKAGTKSRAPSTVYTSASRGGGPALTESNLRALTEVSSTTPSQVPRAYRSPYAETAPRDSMALSRPTLAHAPTAPVTSPSALSRATSALSLGGDSKPPKKKKEIDMNLAYGSIPPDLASRTDLGPVTPAEEQAAKEAEARQLMSRIDALLDEAECVQHTATNIIDHLQRKPEAAAAVALLLAELSTLLKTMSPGFVGIVKGGFPAVFALLASPQFLIGVGVAVGVTVVFFGGWRIVKRIREAKAVKEEAEAFEMHEQMQQQPIPPAEGYDFPPAGEGAYGPAGPGSYDDALVLDEELSTIETWRRGITPYGCDEEEEVESVDLELITPEAVRSVRGDAMSVRTGRTHRSSKSHRSHRSRREVDDGDHVSVPERTSSRATGAKSEAGSERSRRTTRSKATTAVRTERLAIEDGSREEDNTLENVLRPKESKKPNMLKTLFKKKKEKEEAVSVMA